MGSVELVDSCREALLLAFSSAKLSIVEYDPATEDLQTISLHYFEEDDIRDGMRLTNHRPIVKIDPEGRCATMLIYGSKLVVLPFRHDSLLDEQDLQSPQLSHKQILHDAMVITPQPSRGPAFPVATLSALPAVPRSSSPPCMTILYLTIENGPLREISDHGSHVASKLYKQSGTDAGTDAPTLLDMSETFADSCIIHDRSAVLPSLVINLRELATPVINVKDYQFLHGYHNPTILFLCEHLPSWSGRVPVRKDTCGIVAVSINMSGQQYPVIWTMANLPFDCFKAIAVPKPLEKQPGVVLTLDSCNATFLAHDQLLVSLKGGEIYVVTLVVDSVTVRGMKSFIFTKTAAGVITSCMCCVGSQYLFLGSRLGNSLLLKYTSKRQLDLVTSPGQLAFKRIKTEDWMADDTDDLEMYGSEATSGGAHHISYSFELLGSNLLAKLVLAKPVYQLKGL
ncbi:cleavage and polyadenylation specificity factor subunit 1-like [Dysidea avara]|uniref:cleavage and polyadenylation specificity factor subunit 1-like n=1 Tax=Dysidea avara TaxID=196820 RepID=UPI0033269672